MAMESQTLSLFMAVPKQGLETTRLDRKVYISEAEIVEENSRTTSFGEKVLFSCEHVYFDNNCYPK